MHILPRSQLVHIGLSLLVLGVVGLILLSTFNFQPFTLPSRGTPTLQVTTSFYPLYFFAQEIGGAKARVHNITPAGSEPHEYEPTAQDLVDIERSDLLILNGAGLEPWGDRMGTSLQGSTVHIVTAVDRNTTMRDPHVWLSPPRAKQEVMAILAGFIHVDRSNAAYYTKNAQELALRLDELDQSYRDGLKKCTGRDIVTSHAAFAHLADEYRLRQVSISGLSPEAEPSAQQLAEVAEFARDHEIQYIFFESLVSPKLSETIATEIGAQTLVLDPIEGVTEADIQQGKTYFTIMYDNLTHLRTALSCQ